jgi:nicotinamidase/pyrazinamidase
MTIEPTTKAQSPVGIGEQLGLREGDALLVVDVQRDFLPGGSLPVPDGDQVIAPLNAYIAAFEAEGLPVFFTRCWHPEDHISFQSSGGPWPPHCIEGTAGADWPSELTVPDDAYVISKATDKQTEAYSGFSGTALQPLLEKRGVRRLFIGGLATDYCVHDTVIAARARRFAVVLLMDAVRGINAKPGDETRALREMVERGATLHARGHSQQYAQ